MKKISFLLFLILVIFSCKEKINCSNAQLSNNVIVLGFGELSGKTTKFYRLKANKEILENIEINNIFFQNNKSLSGYGESVITLDEPLFSKENYRLIINDNNYDISDIKILSEVRMIGMRQDSICFVSSFKINNKIADQIYNTSSLTFKIPK